MKLDKAVSMEYLTLNIQIQIQFFHHSLKCETEMLLKINSIFSTMRISNFSFEWKIGDFVQDE
jgi:hypothetical protein